jgi:lysophospholipase L1-like esterase
VARADVSVLAGPVITFDEFPLETAITDQYQPQGIIFGGDTPFITTDGANPSSPVLSGTPLFQGAIRGTFVSPSGAPATADAFTLDVGYIDTPGAVTVTAYDAGGAVLQAVPITDTGIVTVPVTQPGSAAFGVASDGAESAGFAIDNVSVELAATTVDYVALGDSFASGEGARPFDPETDTRRNSCHRSVHAWPRLVDRADDGLELVGFFACSGAKARHVTDHRFKTERAQVKRLRALEEKPDLVTITIGGNDVGFRDVLATCYVAGSLRRAVGDLVCAARLAKAARDIRRKLPGILADTYAAVRDAAGPEARIVVVGYPNLMNRRLGDAMLRCRWLGPLGWAGMRTVAQRLDRTIAKAAKASDVEYVSQLHALDGHELCTGRSWVNALGPNGGNLRGHPTRKGQRAMADVVRAHLHPPVEG